MGEVTLLHSLDRATSDSDAFAAPLRKATGPHFDTRGPEAAARESAAHPDQLAIGIDEGTALLVRGDRGEVVGVGTVTMFDGAGRGAPTVVVLKTGERYDLARRRQYVDHETRARRLVPFVY